MTGDAKRIQILAVSARELIDLERYERRAFSRENSRSRLLTPWPRAFEVARLRSGRTELVLTDDNERVAASPATRHGHGQSARGGDGIGDGSAVNGQPMSRGDASQGSARPSRQFCSGADAKGSRRGRRASRARRIARVLAFACIAAIAVLSLVPGGERPHTGAPGRVEHFVAHGGTGFLLALGYLGWRQRLVASIALAAASGVFEILRNFIPGRSPSLFDALASTGGLTLGTAVGVILTAALAWDRADGLLNADRGAAFRPALPFRRRHDPWDD